MLEHIDFVSLGIASRRLGSPVGVRQGRSSSWIQLRQLLGAPPGTMAGDAAIRLALQHSLNLTFWAMLAMSLATVLIALWVPAVTLPEAREAPVE